MRIHSRAPEVYIDSSVFGGAFDDEFRGFTNVFLDAVAQGKYVPVVSAVVRREIQGAPEPVRTLYERIEPVCRIARVTEEALDLRDAYMEAEVVPARYSDDALHVALAVTHRLDVLVSWNFKHLVNFQRSRAFNVVNFLVGYASIEIRTPREVSDDDKEL